MPRIIFPMFFTFSVIDLFLQLFSRRGLGRTAAAGGDRWQPRRLRNQERHQRAQLVFWAVRLLQHHGHHHHRLWPRDASQPVWQGFLHLLRRHRHPVHADPHLGAVAAPHGPRHGLPRVPGHQIR